MTRKDYIALAAALNRATRLCETANQRRGVERAMRCIADALEADNPRFDRQRFGEATRPSAIIGAVKSQRTLDMEAVDGTYRLN